MKADWVVFRFRFAAHLVIFTLGFWVPWDMWRGLDRSHTTWLGLAGWLARSGWLSFNGATIAVLVTGIVCAGVSAGLRTWGTGYLGATVMRDPGMHGERMVADGPYRHLRNPLYLGTWVHSFALAMLMPPSGAVFAIAAVGGLQLVLIRGEERFLAAKLGAPYAEYRALVPRVVPTLRGPSKAELASGGARPRWGQAVLAEIYMWGVAVSFAVLGWEYNALLLTRSVLVSLGVSLLARAIAMKERPAAQ